MSSAADYVRAIQKNLQRIATSRATVQAKLAEANALIDALTNPPKKQDPKPAPPLPPGVEPIDVPSTDPPVIEVKNALPGARIYKKGCEDDLAHLTAWEASLNAELTDLKDAMKGV